MTLQLNEAFQEALKEESVAMTIGSAGLYRMHSLFEQLGYQATAFIALLMQIASAVARNVQSPDNIFPNTNDFLARVGLGKGNKCHNSAIRQKIHGNPQNSKPSLLLEINEILQG